MSRWAALALATTVLLSGCSRGSSATKSTPTPAPSSAQPGTGNPIGQILNDPQAQACLKAAGITMPTGITRPSGFPSGARPSGVPSGFPTSFPSGARPSGFPTSFPSGAPPSGFPGGGSGGGGQQFQEIQQALAACGITLSPPTGQPTG